MTTLLYISGFDTAVGAYLQEAFAGYGEADAQHARLVVHVAADDSPDASADAIEERTRTMLSGLAEATHLVVVSSTDVYGRTEGEGIDETANLWATSQQGMGCQRAEEMCRRYADSHGLTLTILRPAPMFGTGMQGSGQQMFRLVMASRWFAIRDAEAMRSVAAMADVARAAETLWPKGGVYNVCDGGNTLKALAEAMSANVGEDKRMPVLPARWAAVLGRMADAVPALRCWAGSAVVAERMRSLTFSNDRLREAAGFTPYDVVAVLRHTAQGYPYQTENQQ